VLGGGAVAAGSLMTPKPQTNGMQMGEQVPGLGGAPCAPGMIKNVFTGECVPPDQAGVNPDSAAAGS
jgi:hypothetical protein